MNTPVWGPCFHEQRLAPGHQLAKHKTLDPGRQDQGKVGRAHSSTGSLRAACEGAAGPR